MRTRVAMAVMVVSGLLVAATADRAVSRSTNVGLVPAADSRPATVVAHPPVPEGRVPFVREPFPVPLLGPAVPDIEVHAARLADSRPAPAGPAPVRIVIHRIGVDAPVRPVGVEGATGTMEIPGDIHTIGWYRHGPSPGRPGSAVLTGHVDSRDQGPGAFFRLRELMPGDSVLVHLGDGSRSRYRVVARRAYPKDSLPDDLFRRTGTPVLTLITCGGSFNRLTRHYSDNVVVYAVPTE